MVGANKTHQAMGEYFRHESLLGVLRTNAIPIYFLEEPLGLMSKPGFFRQWKPQYVCALSLSARLAEY